MPAKSILKLCAVALMATCAIAQQTGAQISQSMGRGVNLGQIYEMKNSPWLDIHRVSQVRPLLDSFWSKGFKHVRIPVTWGQDLSNMSAGKLENLEMAVDHALGLGFYVILNAHHEEWITDNFDDSQFYRDRFWSMWQTITNTFSNRSQKLIFEILNEPHGVFGSDKPGDADPEQWWPQELTRRINAVGFWAVRQLDATRVISLMPNSMGNIYKVDDVYPNVNSLPSPNDPYTVISFHSYDPWGFANDCNGHTDFYFNGGGGKPQMHADIVTRFNEAENWYNSLNKPDLGMNLGEFGLGRQEPSTWNNDPACSTANYAQRSWDITHLYYKHNGDEAISRDWSATVWDDNGWFRVLNRGDMSYEFSLADASLGNYVSPP